MNRYSEALGAALPRVRDEIAGAAERSGRDPDAVRLVAVTKAHPREAVDAAVQAGLTELGENRVEGLAARLESGAARREWSGVSWHMIGHVQSRKAGSVAELADWVHSLDSLKLAGRLSSAAVAADRDLRVLVQANTSGEESKSGFSPDAAVEAVHEACGLPRLRVEGLMTMAPFVDDERVLRRAFAVLREVRDRCRGFDGFGAGELSMGMSNDYQIAIEEGSTMVRLGTVLFGRRPT